MDIKGNANNYDNLIIAGASLGYNGIPGYENWTVFADQNFELARQLHSIDEINIFEHYECGAYGLVYTPEQLADGGEFNLQVENLNIAEQTIKSKFPFIKRVNKYIIDREGKIVTIPE